ncbi:PX domain-containing protein [Durusdinium trenchii]|uniref:PX domain-containing protein n=1 Tax=Durusdinium trenchii TaxID=1381693 RepID=A0ABP0NH68_9DINO
MSDTKWGFAKDYAHRSLPFKWHHAGYTLYNPSPLIKQSFRPSSMPAYRDEFKPLDTAYGERPQCSRWAMSCYGTHRSPPWDETLRLPRNPFAGNQKHEMAYLREFTPFTPAMSSTPRRPRRPCSAPSGRPQSSRTRQTVDAKFFARWAD